MKTLLCALLGLLTTARAADYYVATTGRDTASGSKRDPWRSIQRGVNSLRPGDVLHVRTGNYPEHVKLTANGTADRPVVIRATEGERVTLDPGSFTGWSRRHLRLEGFHILNTRGDRPAIEFHGDGSHVQIIGNEISGLDARNAAALRVGGTMHDFVIARNHVHHNNTGNQEAIRVHQRTHDFQILDNEVNDNTNIGIDVVGWARFGKPHSGLIRGNITRDNALRAPWASGIYLDGPDNIVVEYNISSGNWFGIQLGCEPADDASKGNICRYNLVFGNKEYGIGLGGWTGGTVHHCQIYNNVVANNKRGFGFSKNAGHHNLVVNNIFYEPNGQAMNFLGQPRDTIIDHNCYFARHGQMPGANSIKADPKFMNLKSFHLRAGSPCIDAGRLVIPGLSDFSGRKVTRPDIGAQEFIP